MTQLDSASTSTSLLAQIRQRDDAAWRRLTQIYGASVYWWGRRAGLQASDAADVVQDVFLAVASGIDQFQSERPGDTFRGWLWAIFRSKLMDHFRNRKRQPPALGEQSGCSPIESICHESAESGSTAGDADESALIVRRALAVIEHDFSPQTWQAFWRSVVLGQPTSEIAAALHLSPAAVCMARSRVLRRLRETLAGTTFVPRA